MCNIIILNIIVIEIALLWIFHAGNESYQITYTKGGKDDEMYEINFPAIWMK